MSIASTLQMIKIYWAMQTNSDSKQARLLQLGQKFRATTRSLFTLQEKTSGGCRMGTVPAESLSKAGQFTVHGHLLVLT